MNKLQAKHSRNVKRNKERKQKRIRGLLGVKTGRLKVQKKRQKLLLNKRCEEILNLKRTEESNTSDIVIEKSPTEV